MNKEFGKLINKKTAQFNQIKKLDRIFYKLLERVEKNKPKGTK